MCGSAQNPVIRGAEVCSSAMTWEEMEIEIEDRFLTPREKLIYNQQKNEGKDKSNWFIAKGQVFGEIFSIIENNQKTGKRFF